MKDHEGDHVEIVIKHECKLVRVGSKPLKRGLELLRGCFPNGK